MTFSIFIQNFFNALTLGSLYGLIAIGYTMVYGILRLINFAHGDVFMLGAYFVFYGVSAWFLPWWVAVIVAILLCCLVGAIIDQAAYRPLRNAPRISALISAIAVSFLIENLGLVIFGGVPRPVIQPDWLVEPFTFLGARVLPLAIIVPIISGILVVTLAWIIYRTKPGLAMRSISKDFETTRLMGVRINRIIVFVFVLGSALAAASGIMWALRYPRIDPLMGIIPGLKAFIAAVFGGIGSLQGALLGGLILGFLEIMLVAFCPDLSGYRDAFAFVLLIGVLLFKPTGLFGEKIEEKI